MATLSSKLRRVRKALLNDLPNNLEDFYTWIFWICFWFTLYAMFSFAAEGAKMRIWGQEEHHVGFWVIFVYGVVLMAYVSFNLTLRLNDKDFHQTKFGKSFVVLWTIEMIVLAVLADIFPTHFVFPYEIVGVTTGVIFILFISEYLKKAIEKIHRENQKEE